MHENVLVPNNPLLMLSICYNLLFYNVWKCPCKYSVLGFISLFNEFLHVNHWQALGWRSHFIYSSRFATSRKTIHGWLLCVSLKLIDWFADLMRCLLSFGCIYKISLVLLNHTNTIFLLNTKFHPFFLVKWPREIVPPSFRLAPYSSLPVSIKFHRLLLSCNF